MGSRSKRIAISLGILLLVVGLVIAEEVTITTYYPAPYGVYSQLQTQTFGVGDANNDGTFDSSDVPDPSTNAGDVWIAGNVGIGTTPTVKLDVNGSIHAELIQSRVTFPNVAAIFAEATAATGGQTRGIHGITNSSTDGAGGVLGDATAASGAIKGVVGRTWSNHNMAAGVYGLALATSGGADGVFGSTRSSDAQAAGVRGLAPVVGNAWAGYFTGSQGLYASRIEAGSQIGATKHVFDIAEDIDAPDCEAGDVVIIDSKMNRRVIKSNRAYDPRVAGIISENPVFQIGKTEGFKPLSLAEQVRCNATTENGPIKRGDLLVTSSKPGYAMRAELNKLRPGMILGKALEPLEEDEGKIVVLVTLH